MSENRLKIGGLQGGGLVTAKFLRRRKRSPPIILARVDRPIQLCRWQFSHKETL